MYDDVILSAIEIAEARNRHGVPRPDCEAFECRRVAVTGESLCPDHLAEMNVVLDAYDRARGIA